MTYAASAHYWLIIKMIATKNWNFISDENSSLTTAILSVLRRKIENRNAILLNV